MRKYRPIDEHKAEGEVKRVFHEIKNSLRVNGINLLFRALAPYERFLPVMWDAIRRNTETRYFENSADQIRSEAVRIASGIGKIALATRLPLGESREYRLRNSLDLYHYINPKLLLLCSAVKLALDGDAAVLQQRESNPELIERGIPDRMPPMEMERLSGELFEDGQLQAILDDIRRTYSLQTINSDYRTMALWPEYLIAYWEALKALAGRDDYLRGIVQLRETSRSLASSLPLPVWLSWDMVEDLDEDAETIAGMIDQFERTLPPLLINIALAQLEWKTTADAAQSPYPAGQREAA